MTDDRQSRLLMQYLEALKRDANAKPPRGLDADTAAFIRRLMYRRLNRRERIWQNVLNELEGDNPMQSVMTQPKSPPRIPLTLVAAMLALIVGAFVIFTMNQRPDDSLPFAAQIDEDEDIEIEQQPVTATPTFTPTMTLTHTWTPTFVPTATTTPTPLPTEPPTPSAIPPTAIDALAVTATPIPADSGMRDGYMPVVIALEDIPYGTQLDETMVTTVLFPPEELVAGMFADEFTLIGQYVTSDVSRWQPVRTVTLTDPNENCLIPANYSYPLEIPRDQLTLVELDEPLVGVRVSLLVFSMVDGMEEPILTRLVEDAILFCIEADALTFGIASNADRTQGVMIREAGGQIIVAPRSLELNAVFSD